MLTIGGATLSMKVSLKFIKNMKPDLRVMEKVLPTTDSTSVVSVLMRDSTSPVRVFRKNA